MIITNRTNVLVGDDTRTSILTINQLRYTDAGNYTCGARYLASNVFFYRYIDLQLTGIYQCMIHYFKYYYNFS